MKMNSITSILAGVGIWIAMSCSVYGQPGYPYNANYVDNTIGAVMPYHGTYYDPKQSGTGIQIDLGANGQAFLSYYTYDQAGNTEWYLLADTYHPSDEVTRWTTGVIGTMSGPFYQARNGQCLGCAYKPASDGIVTPYNASLVWVNSREVIMTVGPQQWDFIAPDFDGHVDGDYLPGSWVVALTQSMFFNSSNGLQRYTFAGAINVAPNTLPVVVDSSSKDETAMPPTANTYAVTCGIQVELGNGLPQTQPPGFNTYCSNLIAQLTAGVGFNPVVTTLSQMVPLLWFDPVSNRFGMDIAVQQQVDGHATLVIGPWNEHYDLYLGAPYHITGRGISEGNFGQGSGLVNGGLLTSISLTKVSASPLAEQ
jgi:hypothetical protein